jgi:hypothetical protein
MAKMFVFLSVGIRDGDSPNDKAEVKMSGTVDGLAEFEAKIAEFESALAALYEKLEGPDRPLKEPRPSLANLPSDG